MLPFKMTTGKTIILFLTASIILLIGHPLFSNFKDKLRTIENTNIPLVVLIDNGKGQLVPEPGALLEISYFLKGSETPELVDSIRMNRHGRGKLSLSLKEDTIVKLESITRSRGKKPAKNKNKADQQIFIGVDSQETADRIISDAKYNNEFIISLQPFPEEDTIYVGAPDPQGRNILYIHGKDRKQSGEIRLSISQKTELHESLDRSQKQNSTTQKVNKSLMPGSEEALYYENYNYTWGNTHDLSENYYEDANQIDLSDDSLTSPHTNFHMMDPLITEPPPCTTYDEFSYNFCPCNDQNPCGCRPDQQPLEVTGRSTAESFDDYNCVKITYHLCDYIQRECSETEATPTASDTSSPTPAPTVTMSDPTTTFTPTPTPSPTNLCTYNSECQISYFTRSHVCCKQEGQSFGTCTDPSFCCNKERQNELISQGMTTLNYCCATSCEGDYQIVPRGRGFRCPHKNNGNREFICVMPEETCSQENHNQLDESETKACCASTCYASNNAFHWVNIGEGTDCSIQHDGVGNPVNDSRVVNSNGNLPPYCLQPNKCDCEWSAEKSQASCMSDSNISDVIRQTLGISSPECVYEQKECAI